MNQYSVEQRVQMIQLYYKNDCSVRKTFRALRKFYSQHQRPAESTIRLLVRKFESTGSVNNRETLVYRRNARSDENIAAVRESVQKNPKHSISHLSQELGLSESSIRRILHQDLGLQPSKSQLTQPLQESASSCESEESDLDKSN